MVDTPGIFDSDTKPEDLKNEIKRCIQLTSPGPHAVLFVLKLGDRYTQEDYEAFRLFLSFFGPEMLYHGIIIFTCADKIQQKHQSIDDYIDKAPKKLQELVNLLGNRKLPINNIFDKQQSITQVECLIRMVEQIKIGSSETIYYKDDNFRRFEEEIQKLEEKYALEKDFLEKQVHDYENKYEKLRQYVRDHLHVTPFEIEHEMVNIS